MRTHAFLLATHQRPELLCACLGALRQLRTPDGWRVLVWVCGSGDDPGRRVAEQAGDWVQYLEHENNRVWERWNRALIAALDAGAELISMTGDDDLASASRSVAAVEAFELGFARSGTSKFWYLNLRTEELAQWVGPMLRAGAHCNYAAAMLRQLGGWPVPSHGFNKGLDGLLEQAWIAAKLPADVADLVDQTGSDTLSVYGGARQISNRREHWPPKGKSRKVGAFRVWGHGPVSMAKITELHDHLALLNAAGVYSPPDQLVDLMPSVDQVDDSEPLVTISMPVYQTPEKDLVRAVESVLAQTERRLLLVVVNDGDDPAEVWPALDHITDPRLLRFDLARNRGRYFADAVTLQACSTTWWSPHDSDDWSEPGRLRALLEISADADIVFGDQWVHGISGRKILEHVKEYQSTKVFDHFAHLAALWRPEWLRAVGGPHPGQRVGYDSVLSGLAGLCGRVAILRKPLYHRCRRLGSLTTEKSSGMGSPQRKKAVVFYQKLWSQVCELRSAAQIGTRVKDTISADDAAAVHSLADELRMLLPGDESDSKSTVDLVLRRELWQGWAIHRATAVELEARLEDLKPRVILEAGSGASTLVFARYAAATDARVITLEHDPRYLASTRALLESYGLGSVVELRHAPLDRRPWYKTELPEDIEFILVDGPPLASGGRAAALPALLPYLADAWELWLDDGGRTSERSAALGWARSHGVTIEHLRIGKGLLRVTPRPVLPALIDASDVVLTLLTGGRSELLADTLESTEHACPGLLATARVIVLRQGSDEATARVLWRYMARFDSVFEQFSTASIGEATSQLAALAAQSGRRYWLHLEDDWRAISTAGGWLEAARKALDEQPQIGQVRLRHLGDDVLQQHLLTRRPIRWRANGPVRTADAHWTFNPTLMRVADIGRIYPCVGERAAMERAHEGGFRAAGHACPGMWTHTGAQTSLREKTRCKT